MDKKEVIDIVFNEDFDTKKGNIIEVTDDFLSFIDTHGQLTISGGIEDDMILSTDEKTYKLRGINLPTTLLVVSQQGKIDLQVNHFLKLEDYSHQYHRIYQQIKQQAPQDQDFDRMGLSQLFTQYGLSDEHIRNKFKISLKEFAKFEEFIDFIVDDGKRLFIPETIVLKFMRNLMIYLNQNQMITRSFTFEQLNNFSPQIHSFNNSFSSLFNIAIKKFHLETISQNSCPSQQMQIEEQQEPKQYYRVTFQSILHFIIKQLAIAKNQYVSKQMDDLVKDMLNIYIPIGMQMPSEEEKKTLLKQVIAKYFIQTTRNNTPVRIYYNPLEVESSLKGRIKFMSSFKNKFTKDEIRGVFEGMVVQQNSKEIKQLSQAGRKSIDMDDLLLKNFRRFNDLYEIKLILPK